MINIHLANDEKFLIPFKIRFEKFCLGKNYYFIDIEKSKVKYFKYNNLENVTYTPFDNEKLLDRIYKSFGNDAEINVFIHFLDYKKSKLIIELKKKFNIKTYWLFYGADLYNRLYKRDKYILYDRIQENRLITLFKRKLRKLYYFFAEYKEETYFRKVLKDLDYFCFWNPYDLKLLKDNYHTRAEFKLFIYDTFGLENLIQFKDSNSEVVMLVNHSASLSGNHIRILSRLKQIGSETYISKIIIPLNYGVKAVIDEVNEYAVENYNNIYYPVLKFLPPHQYYNILQTADVAFFGHRRQEAGGNIIYLIGAGAKIFLREDNSLLQYFKEIGIVIFSFEKDLNSVYDLCPLSLAQKEKNRITILKYFSESSVNKIFSDLIP